jgi:hypothetical protein
LRSDDVPAVTALFAAVFGRTISPEHYRWKVLTRSSPVNNVAIVVDESDRPIFHLAGIPCRCKVAGTERWVMVAVDAMTAPAFRRQGLLTRESIDLFARWKQAGVAFVLGLPNENYGSRKPVIGWKPLGSLASLVLPLRPERLIARRLGMPWIENLDLFGRWWRAFNLRQSPEHPGIEVSEVSQADDRFDVLWHSASTAVSRSLTRDRSWVAWRYFGVPQKPYHVLLATRGGDPAGFVSCGLRDARTVTIAEVFTAPGDSATFAALVSMAIAQAVEAGADSIRTLVAAETWPFHALLRAGFFQSPHAFAVEHVPLDPSITPSDIGRTGEWYLTGGDFDAV